MMSARRRITLALATAMLALACIVLWIMGSAVVVDRSGQVLSATITNSGTTTQSLHRLPGGIFYTIPRIEGAIELRCRDGSTGRRGYVTGHTHSWLQVRPETGCGQVVQLR